MFKYYIKQICLVIILLIALIVSNQPLSAIATPLNPLQNGSNQESACFSSPVALALDKEGNIIYGTSSFINKFDVRNNSISKIAGIASSLSLGTRDNFIDNLPAINAFVEANGITFDKNGDLYFLDKVVNKIRRIDSKTGITTIVAGNGSSPFDPGNGGLALSATIGLGFGIRGIFTERLAVDSNNNIIFADIKFQSIRKIDTTTGIITKLIDANSPIGLVIDEQDNIYFIELGSMVKKFDSITKEVSLIADLSESVVDIAIDQKNNKLFVINNGFTTVAGSGRIRQIDLNTNEVKLIAGNGFGFNGDNIPALDANFSGLSSLVVDRDGNLIVSDTINARIRRIDTVTGIISTIVQPPSLSRIASTRIVKQSNKKVEMLILGCFSKTDSFQIFINNVDVTKFIKTIKDSSIILKLKKNTVGLNVGDNKLNVIINGVKTEEFIFSLD